MNMLNKREPKAKKIGRNELCPCGSGIKYKKCCLLKERNTKAAQKESVIKNITNKIRGKDTKDAVKEDAVLVDIHGMNAFQLKK